MSSKSNSGNQTGRFVFVSGINYGREVFLGRTIDEPFNNTLSIEGKCISMTPQGFMVVRPFVTMCTFPTNSPGCQIQHINNPEAIAEATSIFNMTLSTISRASYPLTWRWIESSIQSAATSFNGSSGFGNAFNFNGGRAAFGKYAYTPYNNAFTGFYDGFATSAEQFRRALFASPQVNSTRELDKLTELEGDLTIEVGKTTNQMAVKFNQIVSRNNELTHYFESMQGFNYPFATSHPMTGWCYLVNRLQIAKNWARRNGKTPLVREINVLNKEAIQGMNEIILEHCSALDTLIAETCTQYGIAFEYFGEMSPFASYTAPYSGTIESPEYSGASGYATTAT